MKDNIRIYVPLDLNEDRILSRLRYIIGKYRVASESNEMDFSSEVGKLIYQIEIYDQIWFVREGDYKTDEHGRISGHSRKAINLVKKFVTELEGITDECAEMFPFDLIEELKKEYLGEE